MAYQRTITFYNSMDDKPVEQLALAFKNDSVSKEMNVQSPKASNMSHLQIHNFEKDQDSNLVTANDQQALPNISISQIPFDKIKPNTLTAEQILKISKKAKEVEQAYIQDCKTFAAVVKLLIKKNASLHDPLHIALKETLSEIGENFIDELYQFIESVD